MPNMDDMARQDRLTSLWDALVKKTPQKAMGGSMSGYDPMAATSQPGMDPYTRLRFLQLGQALGPLMGGGQDNQMIMQLIQALLQGRGNNGRQ